MKAKQNLILVGIIVIALFLNGCSGASTATPIPPTTTVAPSGDNDKLLTVSSDVWKLEIKSAIWGGDAPMIPIETGQKQLLVFTNLVYLGADNDITVPTFGVKNEKGVFFSAFASFGYGDVVPPGGEDWISSFVTGNPGTRHFTTGEAFRPLMFTFAGPESTQSFIFFFEDITIDFTSVVKSE